jgi:mycothiol system anti-sigma-R factor
MCECEHCEEKLQEYVDRELSPAERLTVEAHLAACGDCARYYRLEERLRRHVRDCCDEPMPEELKQRLLALRADV